MVSGEGGEVGIGFNWRGRGGRIRGVGCWEARERRRGGGTGELGFELVRGGRDVEPASPMHREDIASAVDRAQTRPPREKSVPRLNPPLPRQLNPIPTSPPSPETNNAPPQPLLPHPLLHAPLAPPPNPPRTPRMYIPPLPPRPPPASKTNISARAQLHLPRPPANSCAKPPMRGGCPRRDLIAREHL